MPIPSHSPLFQRLIAFAIDHGGTSSSASRYRSRRAELCSSVVLAAIGEPIAILVTSDNFAFEDAMESRLVPSITARISLRSDVDCSRSSSVNSIPRGKFSRVACPGQFPVPSELLSFSRRGGKERRVSSFALISSSVAITASGLNFIGPAPGVQPCGGLFDIFRIAVGDGGGVSLR